MNAEELVAISTAGLREPALAREPRILERFARDVRAGGLVGEGPLAKLLLLAVVSRFFEWIVNVVVKGPSAAGKSFTVKQVLAFIPPDSYIDLTSMSELGLVYMEASLEHRIVVLYEAFALSEDSAAAYIMRSLLSEGRIKHQTTIKQKGVLIDKPGPTGLITTTTKVSLFEETETRLISITVDDTKVQTARVLNEQARRAAGKEIAPPDVVPWHELLIWLETRPHDVVVPFAETVSALVPAVAVRLRRDFPQILGLVRAHALLHRATREQDEQGRIVATLDDYEEVREIVAPLVADAAEATVNSTIRETVEAVAELSTAHAEGVTVKELALRLELDKSSALRRVQRARERGFLINEEDRPGRPARLKLGDPVPDDAGVLPSRAEIEANLSPLSARATVQPGQDGRATAPPRATADRASEQGKREVVARLHGSREQRETVARPPATVLHHATVEEHSPDGDTDQDEDDDEEIDLDEGDLARVVGEYVERSNGNRFVAARDLAEARIRTPDGYAWTAVKIERILEPNGSRGKP